MLYVVYPCFNVPDEVLSFHQQNWILYPAALREQVWVILVDDCSEEPLSIQPGCRMNLTVARILDDKGWNTAGAKNLGFHLADRDWVFQSDIDHVLRAGDAQKMLSLKKDKPRIYHFARYHDDGHGNVKRGKPHMNMFLIHRDTFWELGGFDEDFSGHYGYEDELFDILSADRQTALEDISVTTRLDWFTKGCDRDLSQNRALLAEKLAHYRNHTYQNGDVLRFRWRVVGDYRYGSDQER